MIKANELISNILNNKTYDPKTAADDINIICEGFEYEYGLFKHCQMAFANNKYYLYCPLNDSRPPYILVSDDLHTFHKMASIDDKIAEINSNTNNNVSIIGSYFFNDGDTLILISPDSDILKYEGSDTKVWNYYGKAHIKDTET